jgi:hypothetical protein
VPHVARQLCSFGPCRRGHLAVWDGAEYVDHGLARVRMKRVVVLREAHRRTADETGRTRPGQLADRGISGFVAITHTQGPTGPRPGRERPSPAPTVAPSRPSVRVGRPGDARPQGRPGAVNAAARMQPLDHSKGWAGLQADWDSSRFLFLTGRGRSRTVAVMHSMSLIGFWLPRKLFNSVFRRCGPPTGGSRHTFVNPCT